MEVGRLWPSNCILDFGRGGCLGKEGGVTVSHRSCYGSGPCARANFRALFFAFMIKITQYNAPRLLHIFSRVRRRVELKGEQRLFTEKSGLRCLCGSRASCYRGGFLKLSPPTSPHFGPWFVLTTFGRCSVPEDCGRSYGAHCLLPRFWTMTT